jgi:hypothetical protein
MKADCRVDSLPARNQPFYRHVKVEYKNSLLTQTLCMDGTLFRGKESDKRNMTPSEPRHERR